MDATTKSSIARPNAQFDLVNIAFLLLTPIVAFGGTAWYIFYHGVTRLELLNFSLMYLFTGIGITAGYHRYYTHRSYDCSKPLQLFYLIFGAAAVENSALNWCSDHRYHHRFVDTDEDPYNILRGGLYAHIGWIFYKDTRSVHEKYKNIPDLLKDPLVVWQDKWYLFIVLVVSFALPAYVGLIEGRPVGGLLWGGFLRIVIVHHMTFFINSLAHMWGTKPYSEKDTARDNWMLGPFTFGEGYHNFHHKFQADFRNGVRWYQFDLGKWWLYAMNFLGQVRHLKRTPEALILKAKLEVQMRRIEERLAASGAPERMWELVQGRLEAGRQRFEGAMVQYYCAKLEYKRQKDAWTAEMRRQWAAKLETYQNDLDEARRRWAEMIRAMNRIPHPSAQGLLSLTVVFDVLKTRLW
ncbi:MAG: fatty acid desaturase [Elusimicrobia bacterium]|nr:fatty acid desaturase [Elusimicrobiota bacterium]